MIKYNELLPSYLAGSNISKHSRIIEDMDADVHNKIDFMRGWLELQQPVLVERVASETSITYNIHIHRDNFIKSIIITGDITENKIYSPEDMITDVTITTSLANTDQISMHDFQVTVTDYNDVTYTKGYPENDNAEDTIYDHNELLDKMGLLLNLPRKTYKEYNITDAKDTQPPYFGKEVDNNVVQSCTEDDYYYLQRIREYMENMNHGNLPMLLLQLMYGYSRVELLTPELLDNQQIIDNIDDQKPGLVEQITPGMYVFMVSALNAVNYPSLTEAEKQEFLEKYIPITRLSAIVELIQSILTITASNLNKVVINFNYSLLTELGEELNVPSAAIDVTMDAGDSETLQITDGAANKTYKTLQRGLHSITAVYNGEYGYDTEITTLNFKRILDESGLRYTFYQPKKMDADNKVSTIRNGSTFDVKIEQLSTAHPDTAAYDVFGYGWIGGYDWTDTWQHIVVESESNYKFGLTSSYHDYFKDPVNTLSAWSGELTGRHVISFKYKSDKIYVDGTQVFTIKNYIEDQEFKNFLLQTLDKGAVVMLSHESRITHYMPNFTREIQETPAQVVLQQWTGMLDAQYTVKIDLTIQDNPANFRICLGDEEHNGFPLTGNNLNLSTGAHTLKFKYVHPFMYATMDDQEVPYAYNYNTNQVLQLMQDGNWAPISQRNNTTWNEYIQPVIYTSGECNYTINNIEYCPDNDLLLSPAPYTPEDITVQLDCEITSLDYNVVPGYVLPVTVTTTKLDGTPAENITVEIYNQNKIIGQATITDGSVEVDCILDTEDAEQAELQLYAKTRQGKVYNTSTSNPIEISIIDAPPVQVIRSFTTQIIYNNETVLSIPSNRVKDARYVLQAQVWDNRYDTPITNAIIKFYYRSYSDGSYTNQYISRATTGSNGIGRYNLAGSKLQDVNIQDTSLQFIAVVEGVDPAVTEITMTESSPYNTALTMRSNISSLNYTVMQGEIIQLHMQLLNDELQTPLAGQKINIYEGSTHLAEVTTGNDGSVDYNYTINTPRLTNLEFTASFTDSNTPPGYASAVATQNVNIIDDRTPLILSASPTSIPRNWLPYTVIELTATLTDGNNNPLPAGQTIILTFPDMTTHNYVTDRLGQIHAEYTPPAGSYDNQGIPFEAEYAGDNTHARATAEIRVGIEPSREYATQITMTTSLSPLVVDRQDLTTLQVPLQVKLETNDAAITQKPLTNTQVELYQMQEEDAYTIGVLTTDGYGNATFIINGLHDTEDATVEIMALYPSNELYSESYESIFLTINQATDPLADADFYNISNWGTYLNNTSGAGQTGATTAATTSDLTIDATAKTITNKNRRYIVYNKTLQDFLDYYDNEFSLIAYKTGGDGRYAYGFVNTTTGGYKLGYVDGYAKNEENNINLSEGEVAYQKYNEITYKKIGTDLHIYWKKQGTTYVEKVVALGNINPSEYYLYFRSSVRTGITITNDRTKIQNTSRP